MNEFLEQFLIEARELIEQATDDLLALEAAATDKARLDGAFRAFHTLKGAAGIVEFAAMARALHAAEDVLTDVRERANPVTPDLVGDCLSALDQVAEWLDATRAAGEPPAGAAVEAQADAIVARFTARSIRAASAAASATATASAVASANPAWLEALLGRLGAAGGQARVAIDYRPDPDCFFRGEDPLAILEQVPGLLGLDMAPRQAAPDLHERDPFACQIRVTAISSAAPDAVAAALRAVLGQVDLIDLGGANADLDDLHRLVIDAQLLVLAVTGPGLVGRIGAAGRVAVNVLRHAGRWEEAQAIDQALAQAVSARAPAPLVAALRSALARTAVATQAAEGPAPAAQEASVKTLRVDVERIDALVRLAGQLTVVKNAVGHIAGLAEAGEDAASLAKHLKDQHALLDRLTGELRHAVLGVRVLPLRHVFQRFARLARELASSLGKPVRLIVEGDETEADKAIVESLFEPLLHVLRNAVDHGLEAAADRVAAGKARTGTITLRAARRGEHVVVEVDDDGGGVDLARVRQVAATRGLAGPAALEAMDEADILQLVFAPGFSTASQVTGVSGRGVGMDAVRASVERMGGKVALESRRGEGTSVRFTLPFTVMMTQVMTVEAGGQVFGVPLDAVVETARVANDQISPIGAARAFVLRQATIPLFGLADALGVARDASPVSMATVVVVRVAGQTVGLEVDKLGGRMDVMLKPMEGLLSGMRGVAGTTLLGDGRVLIVLDLQELI